MSKSKNQPQTTTTLGQRIKYLRHQKGITQTDLAAGLVTPSMLSQVESDKAKPSFKVLTILAQRLGVPLGKLLQGVDLSLELHAKYRMAMAMYQAKEYAAAIPLLQELLELPRPVFPTVELQIDLGACCMETGDLDGAEEMFSRAIDTVKLQQEPDVQAELFMRYAILCKRKRKYQLAVYYAERAAVEVREMEVRDAALLGWLYTESAALYAEIGQVEEARLFYEKLAEMPEDWTGVEGRSRVFLELARICQQREEYDRCNEYAARAQALLEQVEAENQFKALQKDLLLLRPADVWRETVEGLLEFALHFEKSGDGERAGQTYAEIAALYIDCGEGAEALTKAREYGEKARSFVADTHPVNGDVQRVLAFVCFKQGEREQGGRYLRKAIAIYKQQELLAKLDEVTQHYCHYLANEGRQEQALEESLRFQQFLKETLERRGVVL